MSDEITVAYLGPRGTYSEEAVAEITSRLGVAEFDAVPQISIFEALKAVENGEVDRAVVPLENSLEGSVTATLNALAVDTQGLEIVGIREMPIVHCLISADTQSLDDISVIVSHPQAIGQCAAFLREKVPSAEIRPATSTAEAVRLAADEGTGWAALGSRAAAKIYDCQILEEHVEDEEANFTRFGLIARAPTESNAKAEDWRTSLVFSELGEDRPGALTDALSVFSSREINLTRIQSHPIRGDLGRYMFFLDLEGSTDSPEIREAIDELDGMAENMKVLGSYPVI